MHIRDYKYTAEDVDCRYCTEFRHGRCGAIKCPWLNERIEAGVVSYHDAVNESFSSRSPLLRRIRLVLTFYDKSFWKDDEHFRRFQQADAILGFYKSRNTNEYYSALFLLTADHSLFLRFLTASTGEKSTLILPISKASPRNITRSTKSQKACTPVLQRSALTSLQIPSL